MAFQKRLHRWMEARRQGSRNELWLAVPVGLAAIYGGYFGAALGVIVLAVLDVLADDTLARLNALKQTVSLTTNVSAALVFMFSKRIDWTVVLVMAMTALVGGSVGGAIASRVPPKLLRGIVISIGLGMSIYYFSRL